MKKQKKHRGDMRNFVVYAAPGYGVWVDEEEDGASITISSGTQEGSIDLNAEQLMKLTKQLADLFGHAVVHPTEWRDQLVKIITDVCERNVARCLDDDVDRRVVIHELVGALAAAAMPKSR